MEQECRKRIANSIEYTLQRCVIGQENSPHCFNQSETGQHSNNQ